MLYVRKRWFFSHPLHKVRVIIIERNIGHQFVVQQQPVDAFMNARREVGVVASCERQLIGVCHRGHDELIRRRKKRMFVGTYEREPFYLMFMVDEEVVDA